MLPSHYRAVTAPPNLLLELILIANWVNLGELRGEPLRLGVRLGLSVVTLALTACAVMALRFFNHVL